MHVLGTNENRVRVLPAGEADWGWVWDIICFLKSSCAVDEARKRTG